MRALLASPSPDAALAVELYCYRARKQVGAYLAALGGADAVLFGGGVGEDSPRVRELILGGMEWCGLRLDPRANEAANGRAARVSAADSHIEVWVAPVDEEASLARAALVVLADGAKHTTIESGSEGARG
jgi:acetate kinase